MGYYDKERVRGFLHNQDGIIVNDFGEEVILRGWGMGNWDNPERFMLGTQSGFGLFEPGKYAPMGRMDRGRSMDQILRETCGTKYAEEFWKRWRRLYLTEEDIALLSRRGYNSVRLPIRAGSFLYEEPGITYNEDSFAMLNDVLDWCETYQVYAVVDFHAATAGQSGIPCDDGVDNGQHLYDDEESMERMFLLMEEFMRRYKDRWIIGAYDCINEPISMTPRREELTPKLVYFYEEMIRRCRKIDQKHLFLLNGTQFSSLTYFFDHEFDPEYHNWGISLHAYEMVVPEVASLASVLRTCREQKICLWMGETGGRNEHAWQTTMYEILAEYHAGYNLWCWKTVEGAGCASILNFNVPDEWHLITDYAINGAAKPSYEHAQAIWDSYLECLAVDKCKENTQYHPYLLREGNFEIPAIGYNALPMDSHRGLSDLPNAAGYHLHYQVKMDRGGQKLQCDLPELLPSVGTIHSCRFIKADRNLFQCRQEDQHGRTELPYCQNDQSPDCGSGISQPGYRLFHSEHHQKFIYKSVYRKQSLPEDCYCYRSADDGRQIIQCTVNACHFRTLK